MAEQYDGKPVFATDHVSTGGHRVVEPGQPLPPNVDKHVVESLMERGLVTDSKAAANRAGEAEAGRRRDVEDQISRRADKP